MHKQLRQDAVRGVGWAFFSSTLVRILQIITTLTLAKLLLPADFGVFALASLIINAILVFRDLGFAQALIYKQDEVEKCANAAFWMSMLSSLLLSAGLYSSAALLGNIFTQPAIVQPIRVMSIGLFISGIANVPLAILDKNLKFKQRAIPELAGALSYAITATVMALLGFKSWSMVIGWTVMSIANTAAVLFVSSWRPVLEFDLKQARVIVAYGKHLMIASVITFSFFQADNASVGKWLGVTALGFYSMAFTVCNIPATNLGHVINRVMFPAYSLLQKDLPSLRGAYLRTIKYISMIAFPVAAGIFVLSGPIIHAFYGQKWVPAISVFHILSVYGLVRSIGSSASSVFMSTGEPGLVQRVSLIQLLIVLPFVYPASVYTGVDGIAYLFTFAYTVGTIYAMSQVGRILDIRATVTLRAISMPMSASVIAGAVSWALKGDAASAAWDSIVITGLILTLVYTLALFLLDRPTFSELRLLFVESRRGDIV